MFKTLSILILIYILSLGILYAEIPKHTGEATIDIGGAVNWVYPIVECSYCGEGVEVSETAFVLEGKKEKRIVCMDCLIKAFDKVLKNTSTATTTINLGY